MVASTVHQMKSINLSRTQIPSKQLKEVKRKTTEILIHFIQFLNLLVGHRSLEELYLADLTIKGKGGELIEKIITSSRTLETLDLSKCNLPKVIAPSRHRLHINIITHSHDQSSRHHSFTSSSTTSSSITSSSTITPSSSFIIDHPIFHD